MKYIKLFETHSDYNTYINSQDKILPNVSYCEDNNDVHYNPWVETRLIATFNVTNTSNAIYICDDTTVFSKIEIDGVEQQSVVGSYQFDTTGEHTVKYTLVDPTTISNSAFYYCTGLTSVIIPNNVTSIGNGVFEQCTGLTSINIPNTVTAIGDCAFCNCTSLPVVNDIRYADTYAVEAADKTKSTYTFKEGTRFIGNTAFYDCTNLTSVTIPNSVTSIGESAFSGCTGLTSVTIPNSVTSIDSYVFRNCSSLASINCLATTAPTISSSTFSDIKTGGTLTVPSGSTGYDTWMGTGNYYLGKYSWTKVEQ